MTQTFIRIPILFFFLITVYCYHAQKIDTTYHDKNWKLVQTKDSAAFYSTKWKINDSTTALKDYYITDTVQNTGFYLNGEKSGHWTYYYPNGKIQSDYKYKKNGGVHWFTFNEETLEPDENGIYLTVNNHPKFGISSTGFNDYIQKKSHVT